MYRNRFCWFDAETKRFYWSKVEGQGDPKKKYMSLVEEAAENGVTLDGSRWSIAHANTSEGKGIDLEIINTDNDAGHAADWAEVAGALRSS